MKFYKNHPVSWDTYYNYNHQAKPKVNTLHPEMPVADSYWVEKGRLMAGEYPGHANDKQALAKLEKFVRAGVDYFSDLTERGEYKLRPYDQHIKHLSKVHKTNLHYRRWAVRDLTTPKIARIGGILDDIDAAIKRGRVVYVHCFGGIGRTGTIIGCYLVRHGMTGQEALNHLDVLRLGTPDWERYSPETPKQQETVLNWRIGR